jgi:RepB DNA-primase from phage plasmid/CHC2 zinc finger
VTLAVQTPTAARAAVGLSTQASINVGDPQQSFLHLHALARPGMLVELRVRRDGRWIKDFHSDCRAAGWAAQQHKGNADVYVGVVPRTRSGVGGDSLPTHASVLWAEADNEAALARALDYTPAAHIVIRSSPGKAHFYWLLNQPIPLAYIEQGNKRLAHHLGCDPRATNAGRILRVAGTLNHKRGTPQRVAITRWDTQANHAPGAVAGHLPDPRPPRPLTAVAARVRNVGLPVDADTEALRSVPGRQYIPALSGRDVHRNMAWCPFCTEPEDAPSLSVGGPRDELWICFGCEAAGDVFRFAALTWGLDERRDFPVLKARLKEALR